GGFTGQVTTTVSPGAASLLVIGAPADTPVGVPFTVTVTAEDDFGNVVTGYGGTVHFTSGDSAGALPPDYTFTATDAGVDSFRVTLSTPGVQTLDVTDTVIRGDDVVDVTAPVTVAAPSGLVATPAPGSQISLSWVNNAGNQTGFQVYRSRGGVFWTLVATVTG